MKRGKKKRREKRLAETDFRLSRRTFPLRGSCGGGKIPRGSAYYKAPPEEAALVPVPHAPDLGLSCTFVHRPGSTGRKRSSARVVSWSGWTCSLARAVRTMEIIGRHAHFPSLFVNISFRVAAYLRGGNDAARGQRLQFAPGVVWPTIKLELSGSGCSLLRKDAHVVEDEPPS